MSNAAISVKGLKKSFKDKEVLKGVDLRCGAANFRAAGLQWSGQDDDGQHPLDADEARWRRSKGLRL
ncbi:hypothetical protein HMSSN139_09810 [Paenibacillus sp. HMSSN-139]|nr:hypothetical protein HMSSN139_09810 [Paenibacillus sp. HMSSN-139]